MNCETEMKFKFVFQYAFSLVVPLVSTYLIFDSFYSSFLRLRARTESTHTPPAHVLSSLIKFVFFGSICLLAHKFLTILIDCLERKENTLTIEME